MAQKMMQKLPEGVKEGKEKISVTEELTTEHGMLDRVMLAMDHTLKKAGSSTKADLSAINKGCSLIRMVVDDHHSKFEEDSIYPKFENTEMSGFVSTLRTQHSEGRKMIDRMMDMSKSGSIRESSDLDTLRSMFRDYHDMMMAHAAWEQTILFPALEGKLSSDELKKLKERQEEHEEKLLGKDATEKSYNMLAEIESSAGISGLSDFTRRAK